MRSLAHRAAPCLMSHVARRAALLQAGPGGLGHAARTLVLVRVGVDLTPDASAEVLVRVRADRDTGRARAGAGRLVRRVPGGRRGLGPGAPGAGPPRHRSRAARGLLRASGALQAQWTFPLVHPRDLDCHTRACHALLGACPRMPRCSSSQTKLQSAPFIWYARKRLAHGCHAGRGAARRRRAAPGRAPAEPHCARPRRSSRWWWRPWAWRRSRSCYRWWSSWSSRRGPVRIALTLSPVQRARPRARAGSAEQAAKLRQALRRPPSRSPRAPAPSGRTVLSFFRRQGACSPARAT